ncbi:MAG: AmmeMemoRadiSam system protein B [Geobacteraceae bacterium]|nr:AmmeMemoRadiSam system protein B [Geobacteraceae bacterium]
MNRFSYLLKTALLILIFPCACTAAVKEPNVAGAFYPADKKKLGDEVDRYLSQSADPPDSGRLLAIVAPHAGYIYSGGVAGYSYARLKGRDIRTVILLAPTHYAAITGAAIYPGSAMKTPLGAVRVDEALSRSFIDEKAGVRLAAEPFEQEHSLEVQLPFLQRVLKDFSIVPVLIGRMTPDSYRHLGDKIAALLKKDETAIIVISTDLSHYHDSTTASVKDRKVLDAVARLAAGDLERLLSSGEGEACGGGPVLYGMAAARGAGATEAKVYRHADSGDVSGDRKRVVGYGAAGFYKKELSPATRADILKLAKETVHAQVTGKPLPVWSGSDQRMKADGAVFVTLKEKNGRLRGCIGTISAYTSLHQSISQNAVAAASKDPRFSPVRPEELSGLDIEVTVLSPMEPVSGLSEIQVGTHGVYLEASGRSSVFLPQVPLEQGWDLDTYLRELALKAGLGPDGWKSGRLQRFTAEIVH